MYNELCRFSSFLIYYRYGSKFRKRFCLEFQILSRKLLCFQFNQTSSSIGLVHSTTGQNEESIRNLEAIAAELARQKSSATQSPERLRLLDPVLTKMKKNKKYSAPAAAAHNSTPPLGMKRRRRLSIGSASQPGSPKLPMSPLHRKVLVKQFEISQAQESPKQCVSGEPYHSTGFGSPSMMKKSMYIERESNVWTKNKILLIHSLIFYFARQD